MPALLAYLCIWIFASSFIHLVIVYTSNWWAGAKFVRSNFLECLSAEFYPLGITISLAGMAITIGCYRADPWVRYGLPVFFATLAVFSFAHHHPWEGYGSLAWMAGTTFYLFRCSAPVSFFSGKQCLNEGVEPHATD
jgi:hypothetical protein